jgi:ectoine hydroxylase-related dioxygenase (phytanoyl-CoA dioxygenase family)
MTDATLRLSEKSVADYHDTGLLRLKLAQQTVELCNEFMQEVCAWLKVIGGIDVTPAELPAQLPIIAAQNRTLIARLYKISRRFPAAKRLASDRWLAEVAAQLMGVPLVSCCHFVNIRIDLPGEEKYLLPPHQDFPYIQGSLNGVTWWIPFADTPIPVGPPSFILNSQKEGLLKVREIDYESTGKSGGRSFQLAELKRFESASYVHEPVGGGEGLIFNTLLLHRSEPNYSNLARINIQVRFDDPFASESYERNYPEGLYLGDSLTKTYPECVIS